MSKRILDTRDLYKRQQELTDLKSTVEAAQEALTEAEEALAAHDTGEVAPDDEKYEKEELENAVEAAQSDLDSAKEDFGDDEQTELAELDDLESEIGLGWRDGESMIPESEFEDYARELAVDIGAIDKNASWPCNCIDWEEAADQLKQDYTSVSYQGEDYYVRA